MTKIVFLLSIIFAQFGSAYGSEICEIKDVPRGGINYHFGYYDRYLIKCTDSVLLSEMEKAHFIKGWTGPSSELEQVAILYTIETGNYLKVKKYLLDSGYTQDVCGNDYIKK